MIAAPISLYPLSKGTTPIGMQIVGNRWREMELLAIAQEIDCVINGRRSPPSY